RTTSCDGASMMPCTRLVRTTWLAPVLALGAIAACDSSTGPKTTSGASTPPTATTQATAAATSQPTPPPTPAPTATSAAKAKGPFPESTNPALKDPSKAKDKAPATFKAKFETTAGDFEVECHRDWAPNGVDRFYNLVKIGFYDDVC